MAVADKFESRIQDALRIKFDPDLPTFSEGILERNLTDLLRCASYGIDPALSALLNCTVGGAGNQPLEVEVIAGATGDEKKIALRELEQQLIALQQADIKPELVSSVIAKLRSIAI